MRRTKAEAAETREAILLAAEQVFLERGVNQSTLTEIACYAGVTRGAIYFHFEDKLDIFQSIIGRARFPQEEIMLQAARFDHPNPLHILEQSIVAALELSPPMKDSRSSSPSSTSVANMWARWLPSSTG